MAEHHFEVWQEGQRVAMTSGPDRHVAMREAIHYALIYGQDGPVRVFEGPRRRGKEIASTGPTPSPPYDRR